MPMDMLTTDGWWQVDWQDGRRTYFRDQVEADYLHLAVPTTKRARHVETIG